MRPGVERPYSAPTTASASADSRALITVCSSDRMRSGLASARASPSMPPGSTMWGAVIVMTPFEGAVRGSLEGSRDGRVYVYNHDELGDRATPLCGTQLTPRETSCSRRERRRAANGERPGDILLSPGEKARSERRTPGRHPALAGREGAQRTANARETSCSRRERRGSPSVLVPSPGPRPPARAPLSR